MSTTTVVIRTSSGALKTVLRSTIPRSERRGSRSQRRRIAARLSVDAAR
ncbi:hypothetical protein [Nonomuraea sp. NPDC023979]